MKLNQFISFLIVIFFLIGCGRVFQFVVLGIRQPKPESVSSIISYGKKAGYNTENQFYFIDSSEVEKTWKSSFPKAFIYNQEGYVVKHLDCFATGLEEVKNFYKQPLGTAKRVSDTQLLLVGLDTVKMIAPKFLAIKESINDFKKSKTIDFPDSQYYIVFYWSKSFGKINKRIGVEIEKYLLLHPEFSTSFIKINCDYQKEWGYTKKQLR